MCRGETAPKRPVGREGGPDDAPEFGEIAVRGPVVMQGYFNRPDATAAVMRDGWLLTGDLGRLDEAGRLTITGRKKEIIVLASGKNIHPEEIEAHYRQSPFIEEICVMGLTRPDEPTTERLHAILVPDADVLRERRIVNAGDWLRFEMEGLAVGLPAHKRVLSFDIWFEPLPKTATGKVKRHEIRRRTAERHAAKSAATPPPMSAGDEAWLLDPEVMPVLSVIRARAASGARIAPDANLELDLGLDSMERVELLTDLEQQFGVKVTQEQAHEILTVRQLVGVITSGGRSLDRPAMAPTTSDAADESWDVLLRDLPPESDPVLGSLLRARPIMKRLLFVAVRLLRAVLIRVRADGLEHLPAQGPFLICPNHQGYLDPLFLCSVLPYCTFKDMFAVGAAEYFQTPLMAWVARQINVVPVDPDASLVPALKAGAFGLAHGRILLLFPEGERSMDGTVKRFRKGGAILARQGGVPIVPVAISGAFEIWPRNRPINYRLLRPWSRHRVEIRVGKPMAVPATASPAELAATLQSRVAELLGGRRQGGG